MHVFRSRAAALFALLFVAAFCAGAGVCFAGEDPSRKWEVVEMESRWGSTRTTYRDALSESSPSDGVYSFSLKQVYDPPPRFDGRDVGHIVLSWDVDCLRVKYREQSIEYYGLDGVRYATRKLFDFGKWKFPDPESEDNREGLLRTLCGLEGERERYGSIREEPPLPPPPFSKYPDSTPEKSWDGMRRALAAGDIEQALSFVSPLSREEYRESFEAMGKELDRSVENMGEITHAESDERSAVYEFDSEVTMEGEKRTLVFRIYFIRAYDGLWLIDSF